MTELLQEHIAAIILALISTGGVSIYIKGMFAKPKTLAEAKKSEAEAAIILVEGWRGITDTLQEQLREMENRYEKKIGELEKRIQEREEWYTANLDAKDKKIATLEKEVRSLQRQIDRYEGMKDRVDAAKSEIQNTVETTLEEAKKPSEA